MTARPEPGRAPLRLPYQVVADAYVVEALHSLPQYRVVGDSLDWDVALYANDVTADVTVNGVLVPAGLYTREITVDGRHVIAHRWNDHGAREELLDDVAKRHYLFERVAHARPRYVTDHQRKIFTDAARAFAVIASDELEGGPLYDAPIRCRHDLSLYVDPGTYVENAPPSSSSGDAADRLGGEFVTAVEDRIDTLLHQRDRLLTADEAHTAGLDSTLRDGHEPRTWASLTPRQRAAAGLNPHHPADPAGS